MAALPIATYIGPSIIISVNEVQEDSVYSVSLLDQNGPSNQFTKLSLDALRLKAWIMHGKLVVVTTFIKIT